MRRAISLLAATLLVVPLATASLARTVAASSPGATFQNPHAAGQLAGLPTSAPAAAREPEPTLARPRGWPFAESFSRTEGTGRLGGGASYWTDFLYDDHGAITGPPNTGGTDVNFLAGTDGDYTYANPNAHNDGADIFRAAVGLDSRYTYWRVDWVTLTDKTVPIAEWTLDSDANAKTGVSAWAANANVSSAGIDHAIVVSAHGARLIDLQTSKITRLPVTVDMLAKSFIVRVPRTLLTLRRTTRVRLAAGVATADGLSFATAGGAKSGGANVYNVTFRTVAQEPAADPHPVAPRNTLVGDVTDVANNANFWMEDHQAAALATGNVSTFFLDVNWAQLAARKATPEPLVYGYSNRWYASTLVEGQGVIPNPPGAGDLKPNYLGPLQPYAVYVPRSYTGRAAAPLTWVLHSLSVNLNQYGGLDPDTLQLLCEDRHSICATTEGRGPDGWYFDEAEVDFWQVWRQLAAAYRLDPERTTLTGYSMGGFASYKLGLEYPDVFAGALALAGPPTCGLQVYGPVRSASATGHCGSDGVTGPLIGNARWLPFSMADGVIDELVPITSVLEQESIFKADGLRYHAEIYPAEDHLYYATEDAFSNSIAALGSPVRVVNPGTVDFSWYPDLARADYGIGPTGDYWIRGLAGRITTAGTLAHVVADDLAIPTSTHVVTFMPSAQVPGDPTPAVVTDETWTCPCRLPPVSPVLRLSLTDVAAVGVDVGRAKLRQGSATVSTDGRTLLTLLGLQPGTRVVGSDGQVVRADARGIAVLSLPAGTSTLRW